MSKISKTVLPCFGNLVAGWSCRMPQSRAHTEIFRDLLAGQYPTREKYLEYFSKFRFLMFLATQFDDLFASGRSSCEGYTEIFTAYLAGRTFSCEKRLEIFSKFVSEVFGG